MFGQPTHLERIPIFERPRVLCEANTTSDLPNITGPTIEVLVGDKTFHIHKDVITASSKFFENAIKPEWTGGEIKPLELQEDDPATSETYCQWLYSKKLVARSTYAETFEHLARAYVLGEKLMDAVFQNAVIDAILDHCIMPNEKEFPTVEVINIIYDGTTGHSPARRLMVDFWAFCAGLSWQSAQELSVDANPDFVRDLVVALLEHRPLPNRISRPWLKRPQSYHFSNNEGQDVVGTSKTFGEPVYKT